MPAVVSGPGSMSKRTDTGGQPIVSLPDPDYGEAQEYRAMQKGAPLGDSADQGPKPPYPSDFAAPQPQVEAAGPQRQPLPGIFDRGDPNMPVTAGAALGPGPTDVAAGLAQPPAYSISQQLTQYAAGDGGEAVAWLANTLAKMGY